MMPSMAVPPPSRANPSRRGIAWEICPRTPPRLQIEYQEDQRQYPRCPKLSRPQILPEFAVAMGRNYFKQIMALTNARKEDVYKYEKAENLERRFWCQLHQDFYSSVVMRKGKAPISLASMLIGHILRSSTIHSSIKPLQSARNLDSMTSWGLGTIRMRRYLLNFTPLYFMMQGRLLSFGQPRG
jgi:hypothetical protein